MKVNFVISKDLKSKIFFDIFKRFFAYSDNSVQYIVSEKPVSDADIYHYHRPQLENKLSSPSVVTVHHDLLDPDPWLAQSHIINIYKKSSMVICLNEEQKNLLAQKDIHHTCVIPHGYDERISKKDIKEFPAKNERRIRLGLFSKYYERRVKGEAYLEELAELLPTDIFEFVLCGQGRSVQAAHLGSLGFKVECYEHLPYPVFSKLYEEIDFLLVCSLYEGGPACVPEAIASGTPVIGTKVGFIPDLIHPGKNGFFISGDIRKDIKFFNALARNKDGIYKTLQEGARAINSALCWEKIINKHIDIYRSLANEGVGADKKVETEDLIKII